MAFIATIPVADASGEVRAMYEKSGTNLGYVPNYAKAFSHRPHVMAAWLGLIGSIRTNLDTRRYELVTIAAARALRSSYCMLAHGTILRDQFFPAPELAAIASDFTAANLAPVDVAIMSYAERIVKDASSITEQHMERLREHGLSDAEIFDIAAAASARCFFSKLLDALGAVPDAAYLEMEAELRRSLTVGRAIGDAPLEKLHAAK